MTEPHDTPPTEPLDPALSAWIDAARGTWRPAPVDADAFGRSLRRRRTRQRRATAAVVVAVGALALGLATLPGPGARPVPHVTANEPAIVVPSPVAERAERAERVASASPARFGSLEPWLGASLVAAVTPVPEAVRGVQMIYEDVSRRDERLAQALPAPPPPPPRPPRPVDVLLERGDEFGLSGESIERMVQVAEAARGERELLRAAVRDARIALEELLLDRAPDAAAVDAAVEQLGDAETALRRLDVSVMLEMRATLDDEELDAFMAMFPEGGAPPPHRRPR